MRALARVLDSVFAIPGTRIRIGLDPIIGLIPGGGDVAGAALSSIIVFVAARNGVPQAVLWRMAGNVALDTVIGTIPLIGDLFDVAWKANTKNVELLERFSMQPEKVTTRSRMIGVLVVVVLLLAVIGIGVTAFLIGRALWQFLTA